MRLHLFEFNDLAWYPEVLREMTVEALSAAFRLGRVYDSAARAFAAIVRRAPSPRVLDLCSGAGGPAAILADAARGAGALDVAFTLTDLFPNIPAFETAAASSAGRIDFVPRPVDATDVPKDLDHPIRTIVTAFHHFPPPIARRILEAAVRDRRAIFIAEGFPRSFFRFMGLAPFLHAGALVAPFRAKRNRALKIVLTYFVPVFWIPGLWDSFASVMRIHTRDELMALALPLANDYAWTYSEEPFGLGGRSVWFSGVPREWGE